MSSPTVMLASRAISAANYENFLRGNYCSMSARVLYLWDYFMTLGDEIHFVWGRRLNAATILFMLNRYVNLLITVLELIEQASFQTAKSLLVLALFIVAAFATLRVYAIWHYNWRVALPVLILASVPPVINIYLDITQATQLAPHPSVGCAVNSEIPPKLYSHLLVVIVNRATTTGYDTLVLILTFLRTLGVRRQAANDSSKPNIIQLIIRDGTLYFAALMVINITQIIVTSEVAGNNYLSYYVSPLTSVLISHFLLDLRQISTISEQDDVDEYASIYLTSNLPSVRLLETDKYTSMGGLEGPLSTFLSFTAGTTDTHFETGVELEPVTPTSDHKVAFPCPSISAVGHESMAEGSSCHIPPPFDHVP